MTVFSRQSCQSSVTSGVRFSLQQSQRRDGALEPMRVLLTGGTGYIGSAVLDSLVRAGHQVDALVRNREKAADVQARGAHPVVGDLGRPETYAAVAAAADGAIHTAMDDSPRGHALDALTLDTLLTPARAPGPLLHLHLGGLGARRGADAGRRSRPPQPDREIGVARAARTTRARGGERRPADGGRPARHRLRRLPRHRGRPVQGRRQRPGARDWHGRESLAARLRPRPR